MHKYTPFEMAVHAQTMIHVDEALCLLRIAGIITEEEHGYLGMKYLDSRPGLKEQILENHLVSPLSAEERKKAREQLEAATVDDIEAVLQWRPPAHAPYDGAA